jgi:hypothetical protein
MRIFTALLGVLLSILISSGQSHAQAPDPKFQQFLATDFHKGLLNNALGQMPPAVFQRCPSLVSKGSQVSVMRPVTFAADGFPNAGLWKETFPISGCGNDTVLNFYFVAGSDEKVNTVIGIPGTIIASPVLQGDARKNAYMALAIKVRDCKNFDVKNSRFEAYGLKYPVTQDPGPGSKSRPWWETWTMAACGKTFDVPIGFMPDATGTQIMLSPNAIAER